ncbi:MAG TPA: hypothetical protein DGD08_07210 [Gemmatimonas aurantiaca]|uniref:Outer membrane protein beta-barrel domain-containing protein n=2 Tax=Gemmatimonas aurantiaca TaxID=173480 RepID=C1A7K5_GEMAT|nr:hypothetical protein [Gemmatimonas aurantiaca]BAH38215.1 hypothetical protein GAU_1173 [Gemmatimonas aurantiaca T-27]HCT56989.1 hypothetical protein [Gemmatimonas aurantiaca]
MISSSGSRSVLALCRVAALMLAISTTLPAQRPAGVAADHDEADGRRRDPFALLAHVGTGRFPAIPRTAGIGPTSAGIYLLGGGLEMRAAPRVFFDVSATVGFHLGGCADWCPGSGVNTDLSASWLAGQLPNDWGVLVGPTLSRSTIAGDRVGAGLSASAGAITGVGPRLTVRYLSLSGPTYNQSLSILLSLRLGAR